MEPDLSLKEQRIRKITSLYYSREDVQKAIYDFSKNREVVPRYTKKPEIFGATKTESFRGFEGFGKRPDSLQYRGDIFEMVKKGATSFHCSEELWKEPLEIETEMNEKKLNELRIGWDLILDIDSKYIDYSKILAELIIGLLRFHKLKNIGIKFSGSKGFHILIPWEAFPKQIGEIKTSEMFPEWPRIITKYITAQIEEKLIKKVTDLSRANKYIKDSQASKEVMPDLVLVSPRHLFRMPYSLHEKTALASIVVDNNKISEFQLKDADPLKVKIKNFMPDVKEGEATELLMQALDWYKEHNQDKEEKKDFDFKPIKLSNLSDKNFPPCIQRILQGLTDGKKRALFILINLFRSIGMEREELEKRIEEWNKKNNPSLKQGIIKTQIIWSYRKNSIMPPNCKEFYQGIGVCLPDDFCKLVKNPVNYVVKKNRMSNKNSMNFKTKKSP